jgi:hypothetical protein
MLYLPKSAARELLDRQANFAADVVRSLSVTNDDSLMLEFNVKLQNFDPRLMLVRAADTVAAGVPMKPGYYHLLINNGPGIPLSVTVIEGDDGEFCEPTSRVFEKLMAGDMRERRNLERFERIRRGDYDRNAAELERERDERREHLRDLVNAYTRTSVSMNADRPWTQNTQPNAVREAGQRRRRRRNRGSRR